MEQKQNSGKPQDEFLYEDSENWHGAGDSLSIKDIALKQFNKAMSEGGKEMSVGGIRNRLVDGQVIEVIVPDQRQIFINSVEMAYVPLLPYIATCKDANVKKMFEDVDSNMGGLDKEYANAIAAIKQEYNGRMNMSNGKDFSDEYNTRLKNLGNSYELGKIRNSKLLLKAISYLLNELDYFGEVGIAGTPK